MNWAAVFSQRLGEAPSRRAFMDAARRALCERVEDGVRIPAVFLVRRPLIEVFGGSVELAISETIYEELECAYPT